MSRFVLDLLVCKYSSVGVLQLPPKTNFLVYLLTFMINKNTIPSYPIKKALAKGASTCWALLKLRVFTVVVATIEPGS